MKYRNAAAAVVSAGLAWISLTAAEFWDTKPFNTWSDAEVKKVLTSSPWAGKADISYAVSRGASMPTIDVAAIAIWNSALPGAPGLRARTNLGQLDRLEGSSDR